VTITIIVPAIPGLLQCVLLDQEPIETPQRESRFMSRRKKHPHENRVPTQATQRPTAALDQSVTQKVTFASATVIQKWGKLLTALICCVVGLLVLTGFLNFGGRSSDARVEKARKMLQINRPQAAIDALANEDSAEGHYLKAVALQSLGKLDAARDQMSEAISIAPHQPKYQGYQFVLQVAAGKSEAVD
jgi:hypothetical protein